MYVSFRSWSVALLLFIMTALAGCSEDQPTGTINGTVNLDGQPLSEGIVSFVPVDGKTGTASAPIKDGQFQATVPVTEMKLMFSAPKVVGKKKMYNTPDSPTVDEVLELIPPRFGANSKLTIHVKKGKQSEKFDLESK